MTLHTANESLQQRSVADITKSVEIPQLTNKLIKPYQSGPIPFKLTDEEPEECQIGSKRQRVEEDNLSEQQLRFCLRKPSYLPLFDY